MLAARRHPGVPPTVVHAALGVILVAGALGAAFDRRAAVVAVLAAAAPDLDAAIGLLAVPGGLPITESTHGVVLHTLFIPGLAALALYIDGRRGRRLATRLGPGGLRLAWLAVFVYAVAGIGLDLLNIASANPFWPVRDTFYAFIGQILFSNQELFVQTYVQFGHKGYAVYVGQQAGTPDIFLPSPLNPVRGPNGNSERVVSVVESGWQLLVVAAAPLVGWLATRSDAPATREAPDGRQAADTDDAPAER
jgi:inner membrane protein